MSRLLENSDIVSLPAFLNQKDQQLELRVGVTFRSVSESSCLCFSAHCLGVTFTCDVNPKIRIGVTGLMEGRAPLHLGPNLAIPILIFEHS